MIRTAVLAIIAFAALPADAEITCATPMDQWQPVAKLLAQVKDAGWTVSAVRVDEGCYLLEATDTNMKAVEAIFDPVTLGLLGTFTNDDDEKHEPTVDHR